MVNVVNDLARRHVVVPLQSVAARQTTETQQCLLWQLATCFDREGQHQKERVENMSNEGSVCFERDPLLTNCCLN